MVFTKLLLENALTVRPCNYEATLRRISCHGRNYSQPYFFKRNQSSDNRSHGFGAKFLLKKLSASDFSYERKSALRAPLAQSRIPVLSSRFIERCAPPPHCFEALRFNLYTTNGTLKRHALKI